MILHSNLGEEEIIVDVGDKEKEIFLNLTKIKASKILSQSNYKYVIYGKEINNEIYLEIKLTNDKPTENIMYLNKEDL